MLETLKLQPGDLVAFAEHKNGVLIKPTRVVDPDDALAPAEAKTVRRGEAQLKRGDSKPWRVVKYALFALSSPAKPKNSSLDSRATFGNGWNAPLMSLKRKTILNGAT